MDFGDGHNFLAQNLSSSLNAKDKLSLKEVTCQCADRMRDEEQKEAVMAEIYLTYEEILQLEQALIELDEQNTTNTLEIRKRDAKTIFLLKQVEEIEEMLKSKENASLS